MLFVIDGQLVEIKPEDAPKCEHRQRFIKTEIGYTIYRYCKECGMVAHEDGCFNTYFCGADWCRCMQ